MLKIYNVAKKAETLALTDANELYANGLDTIKKKNRKNETKTKQLPKGSSQSQSNDGMAQLSRRVRDLPPGVLDTSLS